MKLEEIRQMEEILVSILGEPKNRLEDEIEGQRIFCCPKCAEENGGNPDGKYNLEVNLSINLSQGGVFQCWKCSSYNIEMKGTVLKLIKRYGDNLQYKRYRELISSVRASKLYEFDDRQIDEKSETQLELPSTYKKINLKTCQDKRLKAYLKKRHIDQWTINKFKIGYTTWNDEEKSWANRIIIPSYDDFGNLNFFVGRDFLPEKPDAEFKRPKYKNCDADKKEIVFQESLIDWDSDIILLEGVFDALASPNAVSLLGKTLSKDSYLYKKIAEKANAKIIICLDNDTKEEESLKICRLLDSTNLSGRVYYIPMDEYKDFGEAFEKDGIKGVVKCLRSAKKYDKDKDF